MSEAACRSGAPTQDGSKRDCVFPVRPRRARVTGLWNARWSRTLNPKDFAFKHGRIAFESLSVAATGDACAAALKTFGVDRCADRVAVAG